MAETTLHSKPASIIPSTLESQTKFEKVGKLHKAAMVIQKAFLPSFLVGQLETGDPRANRIAQLGKLAGATTEGMGLAAIAQGNPVGPLAYLEGKFISLITESLANLLAK